MKKMKNMKRVKKSGFFLLEKHHEMRIARGFPSSTNPLFFMRFMFFTSFMLKALGHTYFTHLAEDSHVS